MASENRGIALIMVLWVLTILMVIVLSFSFTTRTETYATLAFKEGAENRFLSEACLQRAIAELFYYQMHRNDAIVLEGKEVWQVDGTPHTVTVGEGSCTIRVTDESGKIDINTAAELILRTFFTSFGLPEDVANTIVDSMLDWRDPDDIPRLHGAESDYYQSLPVPYKAKNADFDAVEELIFVKGMTPEILYGTKEKPGVISFLTVFSKATGVNIAVAPWEVVMAIPGMTAERADEIINQRVTQPVKGQPPPGTADLSKFTTSTGGSVFTIEAIGRRGTDKGGFVTKATVILEGPGKYRYLFYKSPAEKGSLSEGGQGKSQEEKGLGFATKR